MKIGNLSKVASNKKSILKLRVPKCILYLFHNLAVKIATIDESVQYGKSVLKTTLGNKPKTHEEAMKELEKKLAEMEA
jgi:hypothetical protein